MELTTHYGLEFNPFLKNSKEILFEGSEYTEAKFRLDYLARTKGFGLLTGAPGRGKTTLVRSWSAGLNPSLYKVIYTSLSTVTVNDFYRNLAVSLGAQASYRKTENFHIIQEEINRQALQCFTCDWPQPVCRPHYIRHSHAGDQRQHSWLKRHPQLICGCFSLRKTIRRNSCF